MRGGCFEVGVAVRQAFGFALGSHCAKRCHSCSQKHGPWLLEVLLAGVSIEAMRRSQSVGLSERIVLTCVTVLTVVAIRILSKRLSTD